MFAFQITYIKPQTTSFMQCNELYRAGLTKKQTIDLCKNCRSTSDLKCYKRRDDKMPFLVMSFPVGRIPSLHSCPSFVPPPLHCMLILDMKCAYLQILQKA